MSTITEHKDAKELAYLYDLYIVPGWRELFDQFVDEEIKLPARGRILDAGCGTGGYALDLAVRGSSLVEVVGVEDGHELLALANAKAEIKKLENLRFLPGTLENLGGLEEEFDLVIADLSLISPPDLSERIMGILKEIRRVTKYSGQIILKLATRGSFDEFYSFYWQALFELGWEELTPQIETLISERFTNEQIESAVRDAGFRHVETITRKQTFLYKTAQEFLSAPLIENIFLPRWMDILGSDKKIQQVKKTLQKIIDHECDEDDFEVSTKATLVTAKR